MVDAEDSCVPETSLFSFRSLDHDKRPARNTRVDDVLVALDIVCCIVDSHFAMLI